MSSPDTSELIALYTPHRVYWSWVNGQFGGTYQEFADRWLDEYLLFQGDWRLGSQNRDRYGHFSDIQEERPHRLSELERCAA